MHSRYNVKDPLRKIGRSTPVVSLPCHGKSAHRLVKSRGEQRLDGKTRRDGQPAPRG